MFNKALAIAAAISVAVALASVPAAVGGPSGPSGPTGPIDTFQPDGWIKLCGQSNGCKIDPPPHPWRGKDVYNTTGRRQTERDDINEGEGIRYWIALQNDGTATDTFTVQGCQGDEPTFELRHVLLGKHRNQDPGAEELTRRYKRGTLEFELEPGKRVFMTVQFITHFNKGRTYRCETRFTSQADPGREDLVAAEMTTF
jgi:hypothetical protein